MSVPEIIDLGSVVNPHLDGGQFVSYTSRNLTKPGDNYGSCMVAIAANIKRPNGVIEQLDLVAKLPPVTNDLYWQIFQPERTCVTENAMYEYVGPAIHQLQLEAGLAKSQTFDGLPRYYGSRISLDAGATKVDRDAVLVQENLQTCGYKAGNRHRMFDFAHTKLILVYLARYHALPIALRLKKPKVFNELVRPFFKRFNMNNTMGNELKEEMRFETVKDIQLATNNNEMLVEEIMKAFQLYDDWLELPEAADGPWTSLVHCDLWINNIMFLYDENGEPTKLKFVDFQIAQYESLVHDVIYLLLSSVQSDILEEYYEQFLNIYYHEFVQCLKEMQIPTAEYSYEGFLNELRRVGPIEIVHPIFMTKIILADNSTFPDDFKDVNMSVFSKSHGLHTITQRIADILRLAKKFKLIKFS